MDKAKEVCSILDTAEPFMCFDLIYIITLLQDGYDLQPTTKLIVSFHFSFYAIEIFEKVYFLKIAFHFVEIDVPENR